MSSEKFYFSCDCGEWKRADAEFLRMVVGENLKCIDCKKNVVERIRIIEDFLNPMKEEVTKFCYSCKQIYDESTMITQTDGFVFCGHCYNARMVNHPTHYNSEKFEVIDIIEEFNLNFNLGNVIKYILRAGKKGNMKQDLEKAKWYLSREIDNLD